MQLDYLFKLKLFPLRMHSFTLCNGNYIINANKQI